MKTVGDFRLPLLPGVARTGPDGGFRCLQYRFRALSWWLMASQTDSSAAC